MAPTGKQNVLIVDDEPGNIQLLAGLLQDECELCFATSGEEALEIARLVSPDLILLDVLMPGMDGFEVCRRLKSDTSTHDIPVVFVTARGEVDDETRGLDAGGVDYIIKPVSLPVVRARVRVHLRLKRHEDRLRASALIDGLTGIANRRRFDEVLDAEWRRARRFREPLSAILVDVDFFKRYNDRYGHLEGDACLRRVAGALSSLVRRPGDLAARYGGEEFVCLLPSTSLEGATTLAEQMRTAMLGLQLPHADSTVCPWVTVSIGLATAVPADDLEPADLIRLADEMLYRAKRAGRNRVETERLENTRAIPVAAAGA
ncbi:diguanylate cyclase [Azospirillum sp.]|uniref:diguanylate cyclase n=1 Tax=Azospirillum sp. TaxID=34012 RepID=UPI002D500FB0|nr:diguanylate cyclase [Azospirillum sp.]HYF88329.1 diguanylate cyclase [Azospirillum sp.]